MYTIVTDLLDEGRIKNNVKRPAGTDSSKQLRT
jgi:hypothetical protein